MADQPLTILTLDQLRLFPRRPLIHQIMQQQPGIFATTGQPGTGKLTSLYAIVQEVTELLKLPITVLSSKQQPIFQLLAGWDYQSIGDSDQDWDIALQKIVSGAPRIILIEQLNINNVNAILEASQHQFWIFTTVDTPFLGIDVVHNLQDWGRPGQNQNLTIQTILDCFVCVWSQILLFALCENCATKALVELEDARLIYPDTRNAMEVPKEQGCEVCQQRGVQQRCAAYEILQIDEETRPLLVRYLERNEPIQLPPHKYLSFRSGLE
jgi:type II secretory ATPase GspE/PulE/Tfp pilus assembly ATPase PilB-like protein